MLYIVCADCTYALMYDDYSHISGDERVEKIKEGVEKIGFVSATGEGIDFTSKGCDCCETMKAGERRFFSSFPRRRTANV